MKAFAAIFLSVFLAELGDKTQLATLLYATDPATGKLRVFLAAGAALLLSTLIAVVAGERLGRLFDPGHLKIAAGVGFIAIGIWLALFR
jgi:putative Ca2+/H+ antiporter (TMEM165/GDT1 family)